ncbi:MAG: hypothetical protein COA85_01275 [Robiginitomaculum sp.]|nr:MAG: hypothetical protein COA85_01275 [Robiginitomaculum sp.]
MRNALGFFAIFALIVAALMLGIGVLAPNLLPSTEDRGQFVFLIILVTMISTGIFSGSRARLGLALRQGVIWIGIFLLLVTLFAFRQDFSFIGKKVMGELSPSRPQSVPDRGQTSTNGSAVAIRKASDGHFWAEGSVNTTHIRFMVDTGASKVALTLSDARRAGYKKEDLRFVVPVNTASGQVFAAPIQIETLSIGGLGVRNVDALVLAKGLDTSLLGMSYLGRLSRFEASRDQLILRR